MAVAETAGPWSPDVQPRAWVLAVEGVDVTYAAADRAPRHLPAHVVPSPLALLVDAGIQGDLGGQS